MTVGFGVGPKKVSEQYNYLDFHAAHISLGLYYGADLDDPSGVLVGTGKRMRSVKIASLEDLDRPGLRALLEQAPLHLPNLEH